MTRDQIRLDFPARGEYGRIARTAAATLARRLGFDAEASGHMSLAVDEAVILLLKARGEDGKVRVLFEPSSDALVIHMWHVGGDTDASVDQEALARFRAIAGQTVDDFDVDEQGCRIRLSKTRPAPV